MVIDGKICVVTGGAGFIGSHLVDHLLQSGATVRVVDDLSAGKIDSLSSALSNSNCSFEEGSVADPALMKSLSSGADYVFHLACLNLRHSLVHPVENQRVNAVGSVVALEAARQAGVKRFVYCSTSEVYGTAQKVPMSETHPTSPMTVYGASKLAGDCAATAYHRTYGFPVVVIRPFNAYGPRSHHEDLNGELIPRSIVRALAGETISLFGSGEITRDFTYVTDTAAALAIAASNDECIGGVFNIGSGEERSIADIALSILRHCGRSESEVTFLPARQGDVLRLCADAARLKRLTGWKAKIAFEDGLKKTVEFFKNHPAGIRQLFAETIPGLPQEAAE